MPRRAVPSRNPPLQSYSQNENGHANCRNPDDDKIEGRQTTSPCIYPGGQSGIDFRHSKTPCLAKGGPEMNEQRIHRIFEVSVLLKGAHALIECIGGLALDRALTAPIRRLVD